MGKIATKIKVKSDIELTDTNAVALASKQDDTITAVEEITSNLEDSQVTEGGQVKNATTNFTQEEFMEQMLVELRKITLQLAIITDTVLKDEDINNN